ncbi:RagB/SusD family nutrient uptake outer membrane protein [Mucilaginibacter sp. UC70_90]
MKRNIYILYLYVATIIVTGSTCKKFVQVDPPETQAELSKIFADDQTANAAAAGLYYQMMASNLSFCNGGISVYTGMSADEFANTVTNSTYDAFKNNSLLASNSTVLSTFWTNPYRNIYQVNAVLEGLQQSQTLSVASKNKLRGEMLFMRAYHYFYLINLFGPVPYETVTDFKTNSVMGRTAEDRVYQGITTDLLEARLLLGDSYSSATNLRPDKDAATALLARVYLYRKNWKDAEAMATELIGSGKYSLDNVANVFLTTSRETIYQVSRANANTAEGTLFNPSSTTARPTFALTTNLLNAFETGDLRKTNWLKSNTVSSVVYYYPYKYKVRATSPVSEYNIFLRLSEQYLIRSEARANQSNVSGAISDIDAIRSRAGLSTIQSTNPGISSTALLTAIAQENQIEFFAEWGHRWLDLKRTGKTDEVLGGLKRGELANNRPAFPDPLRPNPGQSIP